MQRLPRVVRNNLVTRSLSTALQAQNVDGEFTETAEYPPIVDPSYYKSKARETLKWHEKIKKITTIEEKQIELNLKKYYG